MDHDRNRPRDASSPPGREWVEQVFREHYAELCSYVRGYVSSADAAEDLVQDLFVAIWQDPARWMDVGDALRPMLYVGARHRAFNLIKHQRVRERYAERMAIAHAGWTDPGPDEALRDAELQKVVDDAIAALPNRCREIFLLSREQGLTYRQIADRLGLSIKTIENQMSRALKSVRLHVATYLSIFLSTLIR